MVFQIFLTYCWSKRGGYLFLRGGACAKDFSPHFKFFCVQVCRVLLFCCTCIVILLYPKPLLTDILHFIGGIWVVNSNKEQKILSLNLDFLEMFDNYYFTCGAKTF